MSADEYAAAIREWSQRDERDALARIGAAHWADLLHRAEMAGVLR
jgi:hypothetical protein